jgi:hypothetical protein
VGGKKVYKRHLSPNESIDYSVADVALKVGSKVDFTVNQAGESNFDAANFTSTIVRESAAAAPRGQHILP